MISFFLAALMTPTAHSEQAGDDLWLNEMSPGRLSPAEAVSTNATATGDQQQRRRGFGRFGGRTEGVYKAQITPHWFAHNTRLWYRNDLRGGGKEFILVNAEQGKRQMAFDHQKLAASLSKALGEQLKADRLPLSEIDFSDDAKVLKFSASGKKWQCNLDSENYSLAPESSEESPKSNAQSPKSETKDASSPPVPIGSGQASETGRRRGTARGSSTRSPDGKWAAFTKDHNVFVRAQPESPDQEPIQLSQDGKEGDAYGRLEWSPDSKELVGWRIQPGERKDVYLIRSSPASAGRAQLETRPYAQAGDRFTRYEPSVFNVADRKETKPEVGEFEHEWLSPSLHWSRDGQRFSYLKVDRGHQRLRVIEVDARAGTTRDLIDEKSDTFIWTAHTEALRLELVNWLEKTDEIIYVSEKDGWRHLYVVSPKAGERNPVLRQITKGEWVVRGIERIDEDARQIWFSAGGKNQDQDPYFLHYYRVNFDGTGLVALTDANGNHSIQFSPDRKFIVDTWSRVDAPPVNELRRTSDGKLVCKLEEADITELKEKGFQPPEVFVAKGRDGKTDIWGLIHRPRNVDSKKYPIVEYIYAGPQGAFVPKYFSGGSRYSSLTDLGFIVVQMDGMGTANRSKAFHDVCFHNLKDGGFADRILWMKAAAVRHPEMDVTRVGIYGNSAGGQNAAAAVLFHPEFYKASVASCGCHDNRLDKASWNEQWMGYMSPDKLWSKDPDNWYSQCSNIDNAYRLKGKLLLIVGETDHNVPPESTLRLADALIKANKDFDLLVIPGGDHGMGGAYGDRRMRDFFVRNLLGTEPPNRNASSESGAGG